MLIWAVSSPDRMAPPVRAAITAPANAVFVSSASVWEIAIKQASGRLVFPLDEFEDIVERMGLDIMPIQPRHAMLAAALPRHHSDPFDRMLIAQAVRENLMLVSVDRTIARYDVAIFSAG